MSTEPDVSPIAVSESVAARMIGVALATLRRRVADGSLRIVRFGGRNLVPVAELERLLAGEPPAPIDGAATAASSSRIGGSR